jgi:hypothetical protein
MSGIEANFLIEKLQFDTTKLFRWPFPHFLVEYRGYFLNVVEKPSVVLRIVKESTVR